MNREWRQKVADGATEALEAAAKQRAEERADWDRARCQLEERWTASLKDLEAKAADQAASHVAHTAEVSPPPPLLKPGITVLRVYATVLIGIFSSQSTHHAQRIAMAFLPGTNARVKCMPLLAAIIMGITHHRHEQSGPSPSWLSWRLACITNGLLRQGSCFHPV